MGFANDIIGGAANLIRNAIQSVNFVSGVSGWQIQKNGNAQFNNLTFTGTFNGTGFVINSTGLYFYSGTPAAGNLVVTILSANGTDPFGNATLEGVCNYYVFGGTAYATTLAGAVVSWHTASSQAGPYGGVGNIGISSVSPTTFVIEFDALEGVINVPQSSIATVSPDPNSGSTWVSGERAFLNNWATAINDIIGALQAAGIIA